MTRSITVITIYESTTARCQRSYGHDMKKLQEFVAVFGPYFKSGAEAQFLLADKLLQTKNEADARANAVGSSTFQTRSSGLDPAAMRPRSIAGLWRLP